MLGPLQRGLRRGESGGRTPFGEAGQQQLVVGGCCEEVAAGAEVGLDRRGQERLSGIRGGH